MVSNKPGMDLAALSAYAIEHGMSYGQLVAKIGPAQERAIIEEYEKNREARLAARRARLQDKLPRPKDDWDRQEALRLWRDGYSDVEIAKKLGVTPKVIHYWRSKTKLEPNKSSTSRGGEGAEQSFRAIADEEAMQLYEEGWPDSEMAMYFGVSAYAVANWRRKYNLKSNKRKQDEEMLRQIQDMADMGCTVREIAKAMGKEAFAMRAYARRHGLKLKEYKTDGADPCRGAE